MHRGSPVLSMHFHVDAEWAGIDHVFLDLPRGVLPTRKLESRLRISATGSGGGKGVVHDISAIKSRSSLLFQKFGRAQDLRIALRGGSLRTVGRKRLRRRALRLRVSVSLTHPTWGTSVGGQTFVRRVTEKPGP